MGVPKFFGWFIRNNAAKATKGLLKDHPPKDVYSLSVDMNNLIHNAIVLALGSGDRPEYQDLRDRVQFYSQPQILQAIISKTIELLEDLLDQIKPKVLVMAVDGVAPDAKINQQRQRRYRAYRNRSKRGIYDTNRITPGTDDMNAIDEELVKWTSAKVNGAKVGYTGLEKVLYSSHLAPGEGEHKIMEFFRSGKVADGGNHVVWGLDADLIMLTLILPYNNVYIYRRDTDKKTGKTQIYSVSINALKLYIYEKMNVLKTSTETASRWINEVVFHDFVFLTSLVGNDFLPKIPAFDNLMSTNIMTMMEVYTEVKKSFSYYQADPNTVITPYDVQAKIQKPVPVRSVSEPSLGGGEWKVFLPNFGEFLKALAARENNLLNQLSKMSFKEPIPAIMASKNSMGMFIPELFQHEWYKYVFRTKLDPTGTLYKLESDQFGNIRRSANSTANIDEMCKQYITGMLWVYDYYHTGVHTRTTSELMPASLQPIMDLDLIRTQSRVLNIRFQYFFYYAPTLKDIATFFTSLVTEAAKNPVVLNLVDPTSPDNAFNDYMSPVQQLLTVIPRTTLNDPNPANRLVPEIVQGFMLRGSPIYQYFPGDDEFEIDMSGTRGEDHEGIVLTPFVNTVEVRSLIMKIPGINTILERYAPRPTITAYSAAGREAEKKILAEGPPKIPIDDYVINRDVKLTHNMYGDKKRKNSEKDGRRIPQGGKTDQGTLLEGIGGLEELNSTTPTNRGGHTHRGHSHPHRGGPPSRGSFRGRGEHHHRGGGAHRGSQRGFSHRGGSSRGSPPSFSSDNQ